jgi:hypothetical protein
MTIDSAEQIDSFIASLSAARGNEDDAGVSGFGWAELFDDNGDLKQFVPFHNIITNWGDQYYAARNLPILTLLTVTITGVTNAASAVVTTSAAHGLGVGDKVTIAGVVGSTGVNGTWVISAVGSTTTFTVPVGAAPGAYTSGGTVTGVATAAAQTYPPANGMKVGTGTTTPNKATPAGMDIGTYVTGITANKGFDATYPQFSNLGNNLGCYTVYKTTWAAGEATQSGLAEVAIVAEHPFTDTNVTSGATKGTVHRALLSPTVNKGATDTLAITWNYKVLGT